MNNPKDMLVSDERIDNYPVRAEDGEVMAFTRMPSKTVRAIYEAELTKLRSERDELVGALRVFADIFDGDLDSIGGGTIVRRTAVQPFKDAKAILSKHKPE